MGCHFPPLGNLPDPGFKPVSPPVWQADSLPAEPLGKPRWLNRTLVKGHMLVWLGFGLLNVSVAVGAREFKFLYHLCFFNPS